MRRALWLLTALVVPVSSAQAHYNILLPAKHSVKKGEEVRFVYQWGHPYERQLFDAPKPERVYVLSPDGKKTDLTDQLSEAAQRDDKKAVRTFELRFTPGERGDYVFVLRTPPIWMDEAKEFLQDTVRVVLHVQVQSGWDASAKEGMDITPLTRPYGLEPGMVFQAQFLSHRQPGDRPSSEPVEGKPLAKAPVEIERYSATEPKVLPPDEHITRAARTDPNGVVTCTLTDPGWWCIAARHDGETKERDGKAYPVRRRAIHWVYVDEKPDAKK